MEHGPKISVVMGVYNGDVGDLRGSIESIINQTISDFEFIIVNDGSNSDIVRVLEEYVAQDKRISVINQHNQGLTKSLNTGISVARGEYIARQDADDVSYRHRFEIQLALLESDPSIVLVGGNSHDLYPDGHKDIWGSYGEAELQRVVYLRTPFPHSTAMMRADICRDIGGYDESYKASQDMELWMRFAGQGRLAMVREPVLLRRIKRSSISSKRCWRQNYDAFRARRRYNNGVMLLRAVYYALRGIIHTFLPYCVIKRLRKLSDVL